MSRCRCCNKILSDAELLASLDNGEPEDMCYTFLGHTYKKFEYTTEHTYEHEYLKDGMTEPRNHRE